MTTLAGETSTPGPETADVVSISAKGDLILNLTFETSKETLKSAGKESQLRARQRLPDPKSQQQTALRKTRAKLSYRVELGVLKRQSRYFNVLLGEESRFQEAQAVAAALKALSLRNVKPADAELGELPSVEITDDDEATQSAVRQHVFADLLRILHSKPPTTKPVTMRYVATMAVLADRFDCAVPISRFLSVDLKFKWPVAGKAKPAARDDGGGSGSLVGSGLSLAGEEIVRQKILAAWLLDQPLKLHAATRELIMSGSGRWSQFAEPDEHAVGASWWDLQDDLEGELRYRRECILNTVASVQHHFFSLYSSPRNRACQLGYDSSAACDSYQLGQMVKFLANKGLLFLVDFSQKSFDRVQDFANADIGNILATLKQCPGYQIDKHHINCGPRTRIMPILDYIQTMLASNAVSIPRAAWKKDRAATSWMASTADDMDDYRRKDKKRTFRFTRSLARDDRLRFEGAMAAERMAKDLFTADDWDWTPED